MKEQLTDKAIEWMKAMYGDTIEETQDFFSSVSKQELIHALNAIAKLSEYGEVDPVDTFLMGLNYQKHRKAK